MQILSADSCVVCFSESVYRCESKDVDQKYISNVLKCYEFSKCCFFTENKRWKKLCFCSDNDIMLIIDKFHVDLVLLFSTNKFPFLSRHIVQTVLDCSKLSICCELRLNKIQVSDM